MEQLCNVCQITVTADPSGLCDACHLDKVEAVRDDLLAALKELFENCCMMHKYGGEIDNTKEADTAIKDAEAVIARAEKQAWRTT